MTVEFDISRRYLKTRPGQRFISLITLLSIAGITIGVTALIVVIAVMAGFEHDLKNRIMGIEPHLLIEPVKGRRLEDKDLVVRLRREPDVQSVWPVVQFQAMLRSSMRVAGAAIKGVPPGIAGKGLDIGSLAALQVPAGKIVAAQPPPIVLGRELARSLGAIVGDDLFVISPRGTIGPTGHIPTMKRFRLAAVFETGMYEYDGSLAFLNIADARKLARLASGATGIEVRLKNLMKAPEISHRLASSIQSPDARIRTWSEMNRNLFSALKLEKSAMFVVLVLIVLVATFSLASALVMLVSEKKKDIAILRTMGATRRHIRRVFVFLGLIVGGTGTFLGVGLGTLLCWLQLRYHLIQLPGDVYYITSLPVQMATGDIAVIALAAMGICFLATLYPARQASELNPVEAIRNG